MVRGARWVLVLGLLLVTLWAGVTRQPNGEVAAAACQTFLQTGKQVCEPFLSYWQQHGGLAQQGLPISDAFDETNPTNGRVYLTQYFERARFEYHEEVADPHYKVLLGLLGREQFLAKYPGGVPTGGGASPAPSASPTATAQVPQPSAAPPTPSQPAPSLAPTATATPRPPTATPVPGGRSARGLRPELPDDLPPAPAARPRLQGHPVPQLSGPQARPASLRQRQRRDRLRVVGGGGGSELTADGRGGLRAVRVAPPR